MYFIEHHHPGPFCAAPGGYLIMEIATTRQISAGFGYSQPKHKAREDSSQLPEIHGCRETHCRGWSGGLSKITPARRGCLWRACSGSLIRNQ